MGSGGGTNTVESTTAIPDYEQQFSQANQALAQSLQSQPYPNYQGQLIANLDPYQQAGMQAAVNSNQSYQPYQSAATSYATNALQNGYGTSNQPDIYNADQTVAGASAALSPNTALDYSEAGNYYLQQAQNMTTAAAQPTVNAAGAQNIYQGLGGVPSASQASNGIVQAPSAYGAYGTVVSPNAGTGEPSYGYSGGQGQPQAQNGQSYLQASNGNSPPMQMPSQNQGSPGAAYNDVVNGPNVNSATNGVVQGQSPQQAFSNVVQGPNASSVPGSVVQGTNPNQAYNTQVQAPSVAAAGQTVVNAGNPNSVYGSLQNAPNSAAGINSLGGSVQAAANNAFSNAGAQTWNNQSAQQYMSPYEQAALNPQLLQMQQQLGQQQNAINAQSAQANAFGDARQGVESSLANQNADLQMANVEAQGMNTAYTTGQQAFQADQANRLGAYATGANAGLTAQQQAITGGQGEQALAQSAFQQAQNAAAQQSATRLGAYNAGQSAAAQQSATGLNAFNAQQAAAQGQSATNLAALTGQSNIAAQESATGLNAYNANQAAAAQQSATNLNATLGAQSLANSQTSNSLAGFTAGQNAAAQQSATNLNAFNAGQNASAQQSATNLAGYNAAQNAYGTQNNAQLADYQAAIQGTQNQQALGLSAANQYGQLAQNQIGNNLNAFSTALGGNEAFGQLGLQAQTQAQNAYNQDQSLAQGEQGVQLNGAQLASQLGQTQQSLDTNAANQLYNVGSVNQNLTQEQLNTAYQQFENQTQWPYQMLNVGESAISNSPYVTGNATTLPATNSVATGVGTFAQLAGGLGSLLTPTQQVANKTTNTLGQ